MAQNALGTSTASSRNPPHSSSNPEGTEGVQETLNPTGNVYPAVSSPTTARTRDALSKPPASSRLWGKE